MGNHIKPSNSMHAYTDKFRYGSNRRINISAIYNARNIHIDQLTHKTIMTAGQKIASLSIVFCDNGIILCGNIRNHHNLLPRIIGICRIV